MRKVKSSQRGQHKALYVISLAAEVDKGTPILQRPKRSDELLNASKLSLNKVKIYSRISQTRNAALFENRINYLTLKSFQ